MVVKKESAPEFRGELGKHVPGPSVINLDLITRPCELHHFSNSYYLDILIQIVFWTTLQYAMTITEGWKDKMAWPRLVAFMVIVFALMTTVSSLMRRKDAFDLPANGHPGSEKPQEDGVVNTWCPVSPLPAPSQDNLTSSADFGNSKDLVKQQVARLSAAVNVPTISYDDNEDVDKDPRWHAFVTLHEVLKTQFPRVYVHFTNTHEYMLNSETGMRR